MELRGSPALPYSGRLRQAAIPVRWAMPSMLILLTESSVVTKQARLLRHGAGYTASWHCLPVQQRIAACNSRLVYGVQAVRSLRD